MKNIKHIMEDKKDDTLGFVKLKNVDKFDQFDVRKEELKGGVNEPDVKDSDTKPTEKKDAKPKSKAKKDDKPKAKKKDTKKKDKPKAKAKTKAKKKKSKKVNENVMTFDQFFKNNITE